jgi:hypothetical protein
MICVAVADPDGDRAHSTFLGRFASASRTRNGIEMRRETRAYLVAVPATLSVVSARARRCSYPTPISG